MRPNCALAGELAAVQRRKGIELKPGTETHRLMAEAILTAKIEVFKRASKCWLLCPPFG
jgi:hypothetical protein